MRKDNAKDKRMEFCCVPANLNLTTKLKAILTHISDAENACIARYLLLKACKRNTQRDLLQHLFKITPFLYKVALLLG